MLVFSFLLAAVITTNADVPRMKPAELRGLIEEGKAVAVDVRGTVPYELGHIAGAIWMPLGVVSQRAGELPQDKLIVTYCTCRAEETSLEGALLLSQLGLRVAVLEGGFPAWKSSGFPVEVSRTVLMEAEPAAGTGNRGRLAPPSAVPCDRNDLTSHAGAVTRYRRRRHQTVLVIETNAGTTETITLPHKGSDPSRLFLIDSRPFTRDDWKRIERRNGRLLPGMSAIVWVCKGRTMVDWRPGAKFGPGS